MIGNIGKAVDIEGKWRQAVIVDSTEVEFGDRSITMYRAKFLGNRGSRWVRADEVQIGTFA